MASSSNSKTLYSNNGLGYTLAVSFSEVGSPNTGNNSTTVSCSASLSSGRNSWGTSSASTLTVYWHDNRENRDIAVASKSFAGMSANTTQSVSGSKVVVHNSDGNLSGYAYAYFSKGGTTSSYAPNSDGVATPLTALTKIARFATITNSPASLTDEDTPWFSYSNPANGTMSCWLEVNPTGDHLAIRTLSGSSGTFTWDLTEAERNEIRSKMPNASTGKIRIGLSTTINGATGSNYVDKTFTIINANPIFNDFTFEDVNATTLALTGNNQDIIKGYSKVRTTISTTNKAIAQKGASMVKYRLSIGDSSVDIAYNDEETVSSMISNVTTGTINVYAVDSRNNSTMVTKLANREVNYEAVYTNINNSSFQRDDNRVGDNGVLTLSGTFWNNNFGDETNSLTVSYRLKKSDSSTWINGTTSIIPTISQNTFSFSGMIASDNQDTTWDLQSSYDLEITVSDQLTTSITNYVLASAVPTLSLDKEGVGIMCQYDTSLGGGLQVYGEPIGEQEDVYTLGEVKTNKVWIDGKPIYRNVMQINRTIFTATLTNYRHGIANIETAISLNIRWEDTSSGSDHRIRFIPSNYFNTLAWATQATISSTVIAFELGESARQRIYSTGTNIFVITEYTKTTD